MLSREAPGQDPCNEDWPLYTHDKLQKVTRGDVLRLAIGIWAISIEYEAGESITPRDQWPLEGHRGIWQG
jgi:hypothetical protein